MHLGLHSLLYIHMPDVIIMCMCIPLEAQDSHSPHITEESTGINSTQYTYVHVKVVKIIVVPSVTASRI